MTRAAAGRWSRAGCGLDGHDGGPPPDWPPSVVGCLPLIRGLLVCFAVVCFLQVRGVPMNGIPVNGKQVRGRPMGHRRVVAWVVKIHVRWQPDSLKIDG